MSGLIYTGLTGFVESVTRRGLMRLQTENRRQSITPTSLELSRAGLASLGTQPSSKRASFVPLTGRPGGHRRISSVSDSGVLDFGANNPQLTLPEGSSLLARRPSSTYGRISPSQIDAGHSDLITTEMEGLRREVRILKDELEHAKHELLESNEAREASETCVKALREFIEQNDVGAPETSGLNTVKLPTPPTMSNVHEEDEGKKMGVVTAWGFKLWKDATLRTPSTPQSATVPQPTSESLQGPASATPLSRKLGGLFSSRGSVSSVGTNASQNETATPQLQTNAARSVRDSIYSSSDASSVAEPISPPAEMVLQPYHVVVRDVTNSWDSGSVGSSPNLRGELEGGC